MTDSEILKAALIDAPQLARLSGLSVHTVRAVLHRKRNPRPETRRKLADALRAHGSNLDTLADALARP